MRQCVPAFLAALTLVYSPSISSQDLAGGQAAGFVDQFCRTLIPAVATYDPNAPGIWPPDDPAVFGPLVTPDLASLIERGLAHNANFEDETESKGLLGDGVPWKSVQDAASDCTAGAISETPANAQVEIRYTYADAPDSGWTDTLVLVQHEEEWRLEDIRYGEAGDTTLRTMLTQALEQ